MRARINANIGPNKFQNQENQERSSQSLGRENVKASRTKACFPAFHQNQQRANRTHSNGGQTKLPCYFLSLFLGTFHQNQQRASRTHNAADRRNCRAISFLCFSALSSETNKERVKHIIIKSR